MGDPPTEPNFWSDKFSNGLEKCDIEAIGEVFWPMENIYFPYTMNRPSEEMMDMGMEWYYTWVFKYFGMGAAYSWSFARYFVRWSLDMFYRHPEFEWLVEGPNDWKDRYSDSIPTRYEKKAIKLGKRCVYLTFRRHDRNLL